MTDKTNLTEEALEFFRESGSQGGRKTAAKHGSDFFRRISAKGAAARAAKSKKLQEGTSD